MLLALLASPFLAALVTGLGSGRDGAAALRTALVVALVPLGLAVIAVGGVDAVDQPWFTLPGSGSRVHLALDAGGAGGWLALLTAALVPVALLASRRAVEDRMREFATAVLVLAGCLIGAFLADDLVLFYFLFEAGLLPAAVLIALFGDPDQRAAATMRFVVYTMLGSVPMLVAIWFLSYHSHEGTTRFADMSAAIATLDDGVATACFFCFALAFAVKTPLLPLHSWQAPVYAACPAGAAVLLAGAMAKLGTYGFLRLLVPLFPEQSADYAGLFVTLGILGVVAGALLALAQRDLKRMLAYSSLSHLGLVVVGIFTFQEAGLVGALIQMLAHGLAVAALFMLVGHLERRSGLRGIDDFGALAGRVPIFALLMVGAALAAVAMPGTAGFVGEMQLLVGTFVALVDHHGLGAAIVLTALAGASLILGAAYVLRAVQRVLYGSETGRGSAGVDELTPVEGFAIAAVLLASLGLGLVPGLVTERAGAEVAALGAPARDHARPEPTAMIEGARAPVAAIAVPEVDHAR